MQQLELANKKEKEEWEREEAEARGKKKLTEDTIRAEVMMVELIAI